MHPLAVLDAPGRRLVCPGILGRDYFTFGSTAVMSLASAALTWSGGFVISISWTMTWVEPLKALS